MLGAFILVYHPHLADLEAIHRGLSVTGRFRVTE